MIYDSQVLFFIIPCSKRFLSTTSIFPGSLSARLLIWWLFSWWAPWSPSLYSIFHDFFIFYYYLYFYICRFFCWQSSWSGGHPLDGPPGLLLLWTLEGVEWHLLNFYFSKIGPPSIIQPHFYREDAQCSFTTIFIPRRQHTTCNVVVKTYSTTKYNNPALKAPPHVRDVVFGKQCKGSNTIFIKIESA